jgi:hypothetical protein
MFFSELGFDRILNNGEINDEAECTQWVMHWHRLCITIIYALA